MTPGEAARAVLRGWELNDPGSVAELFAADGLFEDPLQPRPRRGPDDIMEACSGGMAAIRNCTISIRRLVEQGDTAIVEAEFRSQLAATGERFDFHFMMVLEMRAGVIQRLSEYFDTAPLRAGNKP